jgi:RIO kinase 1
MEKGTRYGKQMQEELWQNAEVDALFKLAAAGVRVPKPYICTDGVLLMELVTDAEGNVAPRLNDVELTPERARECHQFLLKQVVLMLCTGVIHGDLSEYNILMAEDGPVIIDLPQAIDAAANNEAQVHLQRDVQNLATYFGQFAPELLTTQYGKEIWQHYVAGTLTTETPLTGQARIDNTPVDMAGLMQEIEATRREQEARLRRMQGISEPGRDN